MGRSIIIIILSVSILLQGCKTAYVPNTINVPLLQEQGELKINIDERDIQGAYAVTENIGIMANGYGKYQNSGNNRSNSYLVELGGGYFQNVFRTWTFETFAGAGTGKIIFEDFDSSGNSIKKYSADVAKFFLQPSLGIAGKYSDFAFTFRFVCVKYYGVDTEHYTDSLLVSDKLYALNRRPIWAFAEPALTLRGGYKGVKLFAQIGHSYKLMKSEMNYSSSIANLGVTIDIADWYRN